MVSSLLMTLLSPAFAQTRVPSRQIPPSVLNEVRLLENRFELTLGADCSPDLCFPKGCTYVAHAVADQPQVGSLPGLGLDPGPGSVAPQEFLTRARCSFAHEDTIEATDVQALVRRVQSKLSKHWTVVTVDHEVLPPVPVFEAPEVETREPEPVEPTVELWSASVAGRELWTSLLPHFSWMVAILMATLAGVTLIWSWRKVGRVSLEEQALLAELARGDEPDVVPVEVAEAEPDSFVQDQTEAWTSRLAAMDPEEPDLEVQALITALLRSGDLPLLAKAMLQFPDTFPGAFPQGGEVATAKLALSDYLKQVVPESLPSDEVFFRELNRHALSASLAAQHDAEIVRSLRQDFGAAGLGDLIERLPPRPGAVLFALAPLETQIEMVRLLSARQVVALSEQLLRSNRMDPTETEALFAVLNAVRQQQALPTLSHEVGVSDRGAPFDAAGALSVLLPQVNPTARAALFRGSLERFHGALPAWYGEIMTPQMLLALTPEMRADLLLEVDLEGVSAWLSLQDKPVVDQVCDGLPASLLAALEGPTGFASKGAQLQRAAQGRTELASAFARLLARIQVPLAQVVAPDPTVPA